MCGIYGVISKHQIDTSSFKSELSKLNHRGPDDHGFFIKDNVAFGQTRLSILDLSLHGHQPMVSHCGNYVLIYNGEIYNFQYLREQLLKKGYKFKSGTDTEVILNGFIEYREDIVKKLNGMFAFAIFDQQKNAIFLARDRSGIKPLYYKKTLDGFSFSSELKPLKQGADKIELQAKILYLLLGYVPEPITIYQSIRLFPAGYYGYFTKGELKLKQFNQYSYVPKVEKTYKEIVSDVRDLLFKSIQRQLISDAPIGTFLSGGLDSSVITAVAAKYKPKLQTLSLVFNEKSLNEEYYQNKIVEKYSTQHTIYLVDEKIFLQSIPDFLNAMEQPSVDGLNTYFISKAAVENNLKTVLSGVGSDEIFYGYPTFKRSRKLQLLSHLPYGLIKFFQFSKKYRKLELVRAEQELAYYLPQRGLFTPTEIAELLKISKHEVYRAISRLWQEYDTSDIKLIEDKTSFFELNMYMKNQLLRDADIFSMANSLELRVPFLDNKLVDYVLKIDPKYKFGKFNKKLLVDVAKEIIPYEIISRPKQGFILPFNFWFKNNLKYFDLSSDIKKKFSLNQLSWVKFWALYILQRYQ